MAVEIPLQQNNNAESKSKDILYVVSREIDELSDAEQGNEKINLKWLDENITNNFETELKNALKDKPQIVDQLLSACESYKATTPNYGDINFNRIYSTLLNIKNYVEITLQKEQAEIQKDNIKVTLRGTWSEKSWAEQNEKEYPLSSTDRATYETFLNAEKGEITKQLKTYTNKRDTLNDNQKTVLILAKHALESESNDDGKGNPVSGEVFVLEQKLAELGYMPKVANDGNNGIDGKFGTKTYEAIIKCMEGEFKKSATVSTINTTLYGEWKNLNEADSKQKKQEITKELNQYVELRNYLPEDIQKVLLLANKALETTTTDPAKGTNEVKDFQSALGDKNPDGKFGPGTYNTLKKTLEYAVFNLKDKAEIKATDINVTLRGEWNGKTGTELAEIKGNIAKDLEIAKNNWENLNSDQRIVLLMAKSALTTQSHLNGKNEPVSDEVLALEKKLNMTATGNLHNGVDGKFGTETYKALTTYLSITPSALTPKSNTTEVLNNTTTTLNDIEKNGTGDIFQNNKDIMDADKQLTGGGILGQCNDVMALIENETDDYRFPGINNELKAIKEILTIPTEKNIKSLQDFLHKEFLKQDPNYTVSANEIEYNNNQWTGKLAKPDEGNQYSIGGTLELLSSYLTNISTKITDIMENPQPVDPNKLTSNIDNDTDIQNPDTYISFDKLLENLPIKNNTEINKKIGEIQELNNQLLEGKSINELTKELEDIDNQIADINSNNDRNEGARELINTKNTELLTKINTSGIKTIIGDETFQVTEKNLTESKNTLTSKKAELEKELGKRKNRENEDLKNKIDKINTALEDIQKIEDNLKRLTKTDTTELTDQRKEINDELKKKNEIKEKIITNLEGENGLITLLNTEKTNITDDNDKIAAIDTYIKETIPQFKAGLDGKPTEQEANPTTPKSIDQNNAPQNNINARNTITKEKVKQRANDLKDFKRESGKGLFYNLSNLFSIFFGADSFAKKLKNNANVEQTKDVTDVLKNLSKKRVNGKEEIIKAIESGESKDIKAIQLKLWTPENKLPITGKIDKATAEVLDNYIANNLGDNTYLDYQCAKGYKEVTPPPTRNNTKITGNLYEKQTQRGKLFIFGGRIDGKQFICPNPNITTTPASSEGGTATTSIDFTQPTTIQRGEGIYDYEEGTFDGNLILKNGKRNGVAVPTPTEDTPVVQQ